ncbi:MAG: response regulator transcription factor [Bacteroidaceae bacterium]|nr:response regulator transcription factor [Bacteroidaceae bacterium]
MILNCYIIDDEPLALELMASYVNKTPFLSLQGKSTSAINALKEIQTKEIDILFLDIQMPELNGMEFSRIIGDKCRIIFTTAFEQYALDSYKVNALDYLLKPISYADFLQSANKALKWFQIIRVPEKRSLENDIDSIFVKTEYKLVQIELKKILYVEGLKDYVKIYIEDELHPILSLMSLKSLEEKLPSSQFIRVHRSFIVQLSQIKVIERNRIVFGKQYIPISDSYKNTFSEYLNQRQPNSK